MLLLTEGTPETCMLSCCVGLRSIRPERLSKAKHIHKIKAVCYLEPCLDPDIRQETIDKAVMALTMHEFDAIAFRGLSGALLAPIVALQMGKTLIAVRKGESTHSSRDVEGDYGARRYVIIDDIVSSGDTVRAIIADIKTENPEAYCIGVYQYLRTNAEVKTVDDVLRPWQRP